MSADLTSNTMVPYQRATVKLLLIFAAQWDFLCVILQVVSTNLQSHFYMPYLQIVLFYITISVD